MPRPHKNIKAALEKHIKPTDSVLSVGPGPAFIDGTPLLALHQTGDRGRVTVLDSQTHREGRFIGTYSPRLHMGHLGLFVDAVKELKRQGAIKREPETVLMDVRHLNLPGRRFNAIVEQNMLLYHDPLEQRAIIQAYHKHLLRGGRVIAITHELSPKEKDYEGELEGVRKMFEEAGFRARVDGIKSAESGVHEIPEFASADQKGLKSLKSYDKNWEAQGVRSFVIVARKK